jgi:hypothetical protein
LPDAVVGDFRRAARAGYDHLIEAGRAVILKRFLETEGPETPERWRRLGQWLAAPDELRDWRVLATLLARVQDPEAGDPVTALADFLRQDRYSVDVQRLGLEIAFDHKLRPAGPLTVYHGAASGQPQPVLVFRAADDEGRRDAQRRVTVYTFQRESGGPLVYRPGDTLYADLPVKRSGATGDWLLTWARARSAVYQFERLVKPPRLHARGQDNTSGELLEDLTLVVFPERGVPRVPDLLPVVKPAGR